MGNMLSDIELLNASQGLSSLSLARGVRFGVGFWVCLLLPQSIQVSDQGIACADNRRSQRFQRPHA